MQHTALLVIDVQQGAFDSVACPPIDHASALLAACNQLIIAARASTTPVIFIQHCAEPDGVLVQGTPQHVVAEALHPLDEEIRVLKRASSAFENTVLDATLKQLNVKQIIVCGLQSEHCVHNTAVAALNSGYAVTLAEDGHHTWSTKDESATAISNRISEALGSKGAMLRSVAQIAHAM
jgi:nicotinamidase-related amidase